MSAKRTTMRQGREVLRLKFVGGVPTREIPPDRRGPVDGAYDDQALPGRLPELAAAGGPDRRRARGELVPRGRAANRPTPSA